MMTPADIAFLEDIGRLRKENKELKAAYGAAHSELVRANNQLAACREFANELMANMETNFPGKLVVKK